MNTPKLSITRGDATANGPQVLRLIGPIVMSTTTDFQQWIRAETAPSIVLDFTEVPFIDSAGLGAIIAGFLHYKQGGKKLAITGMNDKCRALLKMTNVESLFPTYDSVESARQALA